MAEKNKKWNTCPGNKTILPKNISINMKSILEMTDPRVNAAAKFHAPGSSTSDKENASLRNVTYKIKFKTDPGNAIS